MGFAHIRNFIGGCCLYSHSKGWIGYVPPVEELENPNLKFATQIISDDGQLLGTWSYSKENRVYVGYNDLSPNLVHALVATEDVRFSEHSGIDARAFMRAVIKRGIFMQNMPVEEVPLLSSWQNNFIRR